MFRVNWTKRQPASSNASSNNIIIIAGNEIVPSSLVTNNHLVLLAPSPDWPGIYDYAEVVAWGDWLAEDVRPEPGMTAFASDLDPESAFNTANVPGVGGTMIHQATPTVALQATGEVTLRSVLEVDQLDAGMTYWLASCQGVTDEDLAADNVLYGLELTDPDTIQAGHESGTDTKNEAAWELLGSLRSPYIYDITATRDASGDWRVYLDGHRLHYTSSTTNGTEEAGIFSPDSAPANGADSVVTVERADRGLTRPHLVEIIGATRTDAEVDSAVISDRDPRVAAWALSDQALEDELYDAANDILFLLADHDGTDKLRQLVGTLSGAWTDEPGEVVQRIGGESYGGGNSSSLGRWVAEDAVIEDWAGGADYVWRFFGVWGEGDSLTSRRRLTFANQNPVSGGTNIWSLLAAESNNEWAWYHQYGSKANAYAWLTAPFSLEDGDPFLVTVAQADNGDGTQDVRMWLNGEVMTPDGAESTGTVSGDAVTITDGAPNPTSTPAMSFAGSLFSTGTASWWRLFQLTEGTTDTATEEAHAEALFGATGRL